MAPISRKEFETGATESASAVERERRRRFEPYIAFLTSGADMAFRAEEVAEGVAELARVELGPNFGRETREILGTLVKEGLVVSKPVRLEHGSVETYFAIAERRASSWRG